MYFQLYTIINHVSSDSTPVKFLRWPKRVSKFKMFRFICNSTDFVAYTCIFFFKKFGVTASKNVNIEG